MNSILLAFAAGVVVGAFGLRLWQGRKKVSPSYPHFEVGHIVESMSDRLRYLVVKTGIAIPGCSGQSLELIPVAVNQDGYYLPEEGRVGTWHVQEESQNLLLSRFRPVGRVNIWSMPKWARALL